MPPQDAEESPEKPIARIREESSRLKDELRFDEAIALLEEAIRAHPDAAILYHHLGSVLWDIGRCEDSVAAWLAGIRLSPELECPRLIVSFRLRDLGRSAEAIEVLQEGFRLSTTYKSMFLEQIADQYEHQGDLLSAIDYYDRALALDPNCKSARSGRQRALGRLQEEGSA